ncbi:MAG: SDR family oxidoreductase [Gammaproteobacteria bacterium]|nr:SDR family oxidoreductase [Gammaproteobacteria bacterium]MDH4315239.1 SDR family oxidoreductase [Gammaproteobacteria bacterium]
MNIRNTLFTLFALILMAGGRGVFAEEVSEVKAVLVTGASSGIGLRIAETLSRNGFYVYAGARKAEDLKMLDAMENVSAVRLDVTVDEDIEAAVDFVEKQGRGLWGIVNNAGVALYSPLLSGPESDIRFTFDINVFGPFRINQAFLPMLLQSKGRTSIIGSINGFIPNDSDGGYAASKFAVEGYTDSLAMELASTGVHVGIVEPGAYKSEIRNKYIAKALTVEGEDDYVIDDDTRKSLIDFAASNEAMKDPLEVAQAVLHLMSSDAPKRRYLVTPNAEQAAMTMRVAMQRTLQLNEGQPYSYSRDELVALLDELLETN